MTHAISPDDERFLADFEAGRVTPDAFDHRAHVRLAYVQVARHGVDGAHDAIRAGIGNFLQRNGIDPAKYHETITRAWVLAVRHFMARTPSSDSADAFLAATPALLDSRIMLTHYSPERLFSPDARQRFADPDLSPIPRYDDEHRRGVS